MNENELEQNLDRAAEAGNLASQIANNVADANVLPSGVSSDLKKAGFWAGFAASMASMFGGLFGRKNR